MPLNHPYARIARPFVDGRKYDLYIEDDRYCLDRKYLIRSYYLLENDLRNLLNYIEPDIANNGTFSHRVFELFLRACTEFETNCKSIITANINTKKSNLNVRDYFKIDKETRLHEYEVKVLFWNTSMIVKPFDAWNSVTFQSLPWYQDYNTVKHNRSTDFDKANFGNLIKAISGVFVILYSQFTDAIFNDLSSSYTINCDSDGFCCGDKGLLSLKPLNTWQSNELYDFDWSVIQKETDPFLKLTF
jgi:hypothetical protein